MKNTACLSQLQFTVDKYLNVCEPVEVVKRGIEMVLCLPLLPCESSVFFKENPDKENNNNNINFQPAILPDY